MNGWIKLPAMVEMHEPGQQHLKIKLRILCKKCAVYRFVIAWFRKLKEITSTSINTQFHETAVS